MQKVKKNNQAGFTLIEMLVTVLILGILAAMAATGYIGYVKDAKTAEAKSLLGSLWTSLQACAQLKPGDTTSCTTTSQFGRIGVSTGGVTPDGRWTVTGGIASIDATTNVYSLSANLKAVGAEDAANIEVEMGYDNAKSPPGSFTCKISGTTTAC